MRIDEMDDDKALDVGKPAAIEDELDLVLDPPIKVGDVEYDVLHLTEPSAMQLIQATKVTNEIESLVTLIHLNAKVPLKVAQQLKQRHLTRAGDFFDQF